MVPKIRPLILGHTASLANHTHSGALRSSKDWAGHSCFWARFCLMKMLPSSPRNYYNQDKVTRTLWQTSHCTILWCPNDTSLLETTYLLYLTRPWSTPLSCKWRHLHDHHDQPLPRCRNTQNNKKQTLCFSLYKLLLLFQPAFYEVGFWSTNKPHELQRGNIFGLLHEDQTI